MNLEWLNGLTAERAAAEFERCCGSKAWVEAMERARPFASAENLWAASLAAAATLQERDWLEAFSHHPKIGDGASLHQKFAATATWAAGEQSGTKQAAKEVLEQLASANKAYEEKFGFIFIVCATGKSAGEMLELLNIRLSHDRIAELKIAADEQMKITRLRLEKLP